METSKPGVIYARPKKARMPCAFKRYNSILPNEWNGYKAGTADVYYHLQLNRYDSSEYFYNKAYQINKQEKDILERYGYSFAQPKEIHESHRDV